MIMISGVEIVKIESKSSLYKEGVEARGIEVCHFSFLKTRELSGWSIVVQKGLYGVGDLAIYIQPDYCLSWLSIFSDFWAPGGDEKKSRLGKGGRIRAIKFNFSLDKNGSGPIYSSGILIPKPVVDKFIGFDSLEADLSLVLDIKKFEEEVKNSGSGLIKGHIPSFLYKTDEENIFNLKSKVESLCDGKTPFGLTTKVDGSSHTTYFKKDIYGDWQVGVLSRSLEKKLDQSVIDHWEDSFGQKYKEGRDSDGKVIFYSDSGELTSDSSHLTPIMKDLDDPWVSLAKSSGLLSRGLEFCKKWDSELAFRGEIFGKDLKGSGNVFNPHSKLNRGLVLFGVDDLSSGYATRINYSSLFNLENVCKELQLEYTKPQIIFPTSFEDLIKRCEEIFDKEKELGRIIEGVVIRTHFTNDLSCKYLNPEYDSKK